MLVFVLGVSSFLLLLLFENPSESNMSDDRDDLKEVVYASTSCSTFWRTNLFDMWENKTHDYKNDLIFQKCSQWLEFEKYANTAYDSSPKQLNLSWSIVLIQKILLTQKDSLILMVLTILIQ